MKKIIKVYFPICLLLFTPLISQASFTDNFFDDLKDNFKSRFLERENSISTSTSSQSNVQIKNQINVSANTGGNIESQIEETGTAKIKVEIQNEINGEALEPIIIEKENKGEANVSVEQNIIASDENDKTSVETEIQISKNTETRKKELVSHWWQGFFKNLKLKLANIFNIWRK